MNKLSDSDRQEIREEVRNNLILDFVESYGRWKRSLVDVNRIIEEEVRKNLIVTPFNYDSLYTYDELCIESLFAVDKLPLESNLDPNLISKEITQQVVSNKLRDVILEHIELNR